MKSYYSISQGPSNLWLTKFNPPWLCLLFLKSQKWMHIVDEKYIYKVFEGWKKEIRKINIKKQAKRHLYQKKEFAQK